MFFQVWVRLFLLCCIVQRHVLGGVGLLETAQQEKMVVYSCCTKCSSLKAPSNNSVP